MCGEAHLKEWCRLKDRSDTVLEVGGLLFEKSDDAEFPVSWSNQTCTEVLTLNLSLDPSSECQG